MTTRDRLIAVTVAILWGLNFLAIRAGLDHYPPFFFAGLRFLVIAVPVVLFVPRPKVPVKWLLLYGIGFGFLQFAFLFTAIDIGMPTGLASLVLQTSAPFTMILGVLLLKEKVGRPQVIGISVAIAGMALIGWDRAQHAPLLPVVLTLLAALGWAFGNLGSRLAASSQPLRLMLWMTVIPPLPMLAISAAVEGPTTGWAAVGASFSGAGWPGLVGLAYIVVLGTIVGSGLWTYLLSRYSAGTVAPFSLLVPVVGIGASWMFLHETPTVLSLVGGAIVVTGLVCTARPNRPSRSSARVPAPTPASAASTSS